MKIGFVPMALVSAVLALSGCSSTSSGSSPLIPDKAIQLTAGTAVSMSTVVAAAGGCQRNAAKTSQRAAKIVLVHQARVDRGAFAQKVVCPQRPGGLSPDAAIHAAACPFKLEA